MNLVYLSNQVVYLVYLVYLLESGGGNLTIITVSPSGELLHMH